MKVGIYGAGYVGLVTGACLADKGNQVTIKDIDPRKVEMLNQARLEVPFHEPGLEELVTSNVRQGRLSFTVKDDPAVHDSDVVMLAVGTPEKEDGSADLRYVYAAAESVRHSIGEYVSNKSIVVATKSTVPPGTGREICAILGEKKSKGCFVGYASLPEFLAEGTAVRDFTFPDRIVIGVNEEHTRKVLTELFEPFTKSGAPIFVGSVEDAEMIKYASNFLLALRISAMNELAEVCSRVEADVDNVRRAVGADKRIGSRFLYPGLGYGGSCFPKDVQALVRLGMGLGVNMGIARAVEERNYLQPRHFVVREITPYYNNHGNSIEYRTLAVWGLSFKKQSDDMRES